jgi:diaminohydroxyphosphoribosylaminopyrimidine deaminase/5-amino-6-(5-phosphoribosylamino)uracil reductase
MAGGEDAAWMRRALRLASRSAGMTWPNPGVGCVLVRAGMILGQGRHVCCGDLHAETAALADCRARGHDPAGATAYVTLAPCTRHGRQPPCTEALVAARIARVVVAVADPAQDDARSVLTAHGIAYDTGVEAAAAAHLHGGFLTRIRLGRPRFTGKWAMSLDGAIAAADGRGGALSSPLALAAMRRRRRACDAILIGAGTAAVDDPTLLASTPRRPGPVRVVVSAQGRAAPRLLATIPAAPLWVVHDHRAPSEALATLACGGARTFAVADAHDPRAVAAVLGAQGLNDVVVEGGAAVHGVWLRAGLYDRLEVYLAPCVLGGGLPAAVGAGCAVAAAAGYIAEEPPQQLDGTMRLRLRRRA